MPSKRKSKTSIEITKHEVKSVAEIPLGLCKIVTMLDDTKRAVKRFDDNRVDIEEVNLLIAQTRMIAYSCAYVLAEYGFNEMIGEFEFVTEMFNYARDNRGAIGPNELKNWRTLTGEFLKGVAEFKVTYEELERSFGEQIALPLDQGGEGKACANGHDFSLDAGQTCADCGISIDDVKA